MPIRGWMRLFNDKWYPSTITNRALTIDFHSNVKYSGYPQVDSFSKLGSRKKIQYADHATAIDIIHLSFNSSMMADETKYYSLKHLPEIDETMFQIGQCFEYCLFSVDRFRWYFFCNSCCYLVYIVCIKKEFWTKVHFVFILV